MKNQLLLLILGSIAFPCGAMHGDFKEQGLEMVSLEDRQGSRRTTRDERSEVRPSLDLERPLDGRRSSVSSLTSGLLDSGEEKHQDIFSPSASSLPAVRYEIPKDLTESYERAVAKIKKQSEGNFFTRWWRSRRKKETRTFDQINTEEQRIEDTIGELKLQLSVKRSISDKKLTQNILEEIARLNVKRNQLSQEKTSAGTTYLQEKNKKFISDYQKEQQNQAPKDRKKIQSTKRFFLVERYETGGLSKQEAAIKADEDLKTESIQRENEKKESQLRAIGNNIRDQKRAAAQGRRREMSPETREISQEYNLRKFGSPEEAALYGEIGRKKWELKRKDYELPPKPIK